MHTVNFINLFHYTFITNDSPLCQILGRIVKNILQSNKYVQISQIHSHFTQVLLCSWWDTSGNMYELEQAIVFCLVSHLFDHIPARDGLLLAFKSLGGTSDISKLHHLKCDNVGSVLF